MPQKIDTIAPEKEPEYVGSHSALTAEHCQNWIEYRTEHPTPPIRGFIARLASLLGVSWLAEHQSPTTEISHERCKADATHTVVMADGNGLHEISMCDDCGEPEGVDRYGREWTGTLRDDEP